MADGHVTKSVSVEKKVDGAKELRGLILRHRGHSDEARQLAEPVVKAMAGLGLAQMDVNRGVLAHDRQVEVRDTIAGLVEDLSDHDDAPDDETPDDPPSVFAAP